MTVSSPPSSKHPIHRLFAAPGERATSRPSSGGAESHGVLFAQLCAWLPLLVLSVLEGRALAGEQPFYSDVAVHVRILVVLPVLLLGRPIADRLFARTVRFLVDARAIVPERRARFEAWLGRFKALRDSSALLLFLVALGYALTWGEYQLPTSRALSWKYAEAGPTAAGVWYFLFSRPLLLTLLVSWVWTFGLWTWLLFNLVRLPLSLFAYHPDGVGGIEPLLTAHRVFVLLAFAVGAELGGALANRMLHYGEPFLMYRVTLITVVVALTLLLLAPLLLLSRRLVPARLDALDEYGAMGFALSRAVRSGAIRAFQAGLDDPFEQLISAHADAHTGHRVILETPVVPISRTYALTFLLASAIPILLAALTGIPLQVVIDQLRKLVVP